MVKDLYAPGNELYVQNREEVQKFCEEVMKKTATEIATVLSVSIPEKLLEKLTFEYFLPRSRFFSWNFLPASFKPGGMIDFYCDEARGLEDLLATEEGERLVKTLNYHLFSIHAECMSPFLENCGRKEMLLRSFLMDIGTVKNNFEVYKIGVLPEKIDDKNYLLSLLRKHFGNAEIDDDGVLLGLFKTEDRGPNMERLARVYNELFNRVSYIESKQLLFYMYQMCLLYGLKHTQVVDEIAPLTSKELDSYLIHRYQLAKPR